VEGKGALSQTLLSKRAAKEKCVHLEQGGEEEKARSSHKQKNIRSLENDLNGYNEETLDGVA